MFGIFKSYKRLFSNGAAEDFNRMAAFLTNFSTNESLSFDRPDNPSPDAPPTISVNAEWLKSFADGKYVTLDTAQTITGAKTFNATMTLGNVNLTLNSTGQYSNYLSVRNNATPADVTRRTMIARGVIYIDGNTDSNGAPELYFRHMANGDGTTKAKISITSDGLLILAANGGNANYTGNTVRLYNAPIDTTDTAAKAIATMGWVNDKFWRKPASSTGFVYNTQGTISHKAFGTSAGTVAEGNHTHTVSSITDLNLSGYLQTSAVGTSTQIGRLKTLVGQLNSSGKVPLTMLTGNISGHSGNCVVTIDNNGNLDHSGNAAFEALTLLTSDYETAQGVLPYLVPVTNNSGDIQAIAYASSAISGAHSSWTHLIPILTSAPSTNKVLTVKSGGTVLSWEDGGSAAQNPGNAVTNLAVAATQTTADATTWTAGGANGVVVREYGRTVWNGTNLYGYYRDKTYDKAGRLYAVSAETRYTIDTPVKVTWS